MLLLTAHFDLGPQATDYSLDGDVTWLLRAPSTAAGVSRRVTARGRGRGSAQAEWGPRRQPSPRYTPHVPPAAGTVRA